MADESPDESEKWTRWDTLGCLAIIAIIVVLGFGALTLLGTAIGIVIRAAREVGGM